MREVKFKFKFEKMSQGWKRALLSLRKYGQEGGRLEETLSTLKLLVQLSLDIKNR